MITMSNFLKITAVNPLLHMGHYSVRMTQNFDFKIRRDHQKISYYRRVYESAYLRLYLKNRRKEELMQQRVKGLDRNY